MLKIFVEIFLLLSGVTFLEGAITIDTATSIIRKIAQPMFYGFHSGSNDTAYSNDPRELLSKGYTLRIVKMAIIPPNFHVLLNSGGEYQCLKKEIISLCKLTPIYTFYDSYDKCTYFAKNKYERRLKRPSSRTLNKLIGYLSTSQSVCGASLNYTRIHVNNLLANNRNIRIYLPEDVPTFERQNVNFPQYYRHIIYPNFVWGWEPTSRDADEQGDYLLKLFSQTLDGKPINFNSICPGDLDDEITTDKDYIDDYLSLTDFDQFGEILPGGGNFVTPDPADVNTTRTGCQHDIGYHITFL